MVWRRVPLASRSSLGCYVLLLCVCCWDRYRVFWRHQSAADQSQRELSQWNGPSDHIFVYNTFLYDRRPPADDTSGGAIKLVVLFLAERVERPAQDEMRCVVSTNSLAVKRFSQRTEVVTSLGICALDLFVLTCTMDQLPPNSALFEGAERNQFSLILREKQGIGQAARVELQLSQPSYEPRGMVMCISRVFAYERWQLFITAMETYRQFKVDLVVTHVQSALAGLMALMRAYERQGLLAIRPGIHFPHRRDMRWDPNAETEFNGQILLAHECFYEFRESAQFIALIDWDDLLVPSGHFPSLPAAFSAATAALSNARSEPAYFLVNKLEASFVEQTTDPSEFSLRKLLERGVLTAQMYNDEKMVVRPKMVRGFWMHNSYMLEPRGVRVQLLTNYSLLLHLANDDRVNADEFATPFMRRFNISAMDAHAARLLAELRHSHVPVNLPRRHPYYDAIADCHKFIFAYYKSTGQEQAKCLSYSLCELPSDLGVRCVTTRSSFRTLRRKNGRIVVHLRRNSHFAELERGCVDAGGI